MASRFGLDASTRSASFSGARVPTILSVRPVTEYGWASAAPGTAAIAAATTAKAADACNWSIACLLVGWGCAPPAAPLALAIPVGRNCPATKVPLSVPPLRGEAGRGHEERLE